MDVFQATVGNRSYPPDTGGYQRTHGLTVSFSDHGDTVYRYCCTGPIATYYAEGELIDREVRIAPEIREHRSYSLLHDIPKAPSMLGCPAFLWPAVFELWPGKRLLEQASGHDLLLADNPYLALFLGENTETPTVYSSHNVEHQRYRSGIDGRFGEFFGGMLERIERRAARQVDAVACTTESDRETFARDAETMIVVPNGIQASSVRNRSQPTDRAQYGIPEDSIVAAFLGSDYGPNVEAAEWLAANWRELDGDHHLLVLGNAGDGIDASSGTVHTTGYVEDLEATLAMADVALNPITSGGGSNVKLIEYFAAGLPVVSTPFGARGFDVEDGTHLLATELDGFLAAIDRLAGDGELRETLGANAYRLAEDRYTWEGLSDQFRTELRAKLSLPA
jgi:glycosyltransferase involved in cell wall biosynthesis